MKRILVTLLILCSAAVFADVRDIVIEFGEGYGETSEEALKEAMRDAVQKAVGVYLRSDLKIENEDIIEDQVLTHSAAFIDHYKKVDEGESEDGRGKFVSIKAWIKIRDFANTLRKTKPKRNSAADGVLMDFDISNILSAEELLRKELENFNPILDLMEIGIVETVRPNVADPSDDEITLRYIFEISYSEEKYNEAFVPRMTSLLDQIAEKKLSSSYKTLSEKQADIYPYRPNSGFWRAHSVNGTLYTRKDRKSRRLPNVVSVVTKIPKMGGVLSVKSWQLPRHLYQAYMGLRYECRNRANDVYVELSLNDEMNQAVATASVGLPTTAYWSGIVGDWGTSGTFVDYDFHPLICRWANNVSSNDTNIAEYCNRYIGYIDIVIPRKDLSKIKTACIKLVGDEE